MASSALERRKMDVKLMKLNLMTYCDILNKSLQIWDDRDDDGDDDGSMVSQEGQLLLSNLHCLYISSIFENYFISFDEIMYLIL